MPIDVVLDTFIAPMRDNATLILAALFMTLLDFAVGLVSAAIHHDTRSNKMRDGIDHKLKNVAFILMADVLDAAIGTGALLGFEPVMLTCCLWLIIMEAISVNENLKKYGNDNMANNPLGIVLERAKGQIGGDDE